MRSATDTLTDKISGLRGAGREELMVKIINENHFHVCLELGVWKGEFAANILKHCPEIKKYYLLDPWRRMKSWNKPANVSDEEFRHIYQEALDRTDFAASRRIILRGTTLEMADQIPDDSLDFAYIDGDHTLRGVTIDLMRIYPKIRLGGVVAGDDYSASIWHHPENFEPSLVCPYVAYFAESQKAPLVIHSHNQFVIIKPLEQGNHFRVLDMCNGYGSRDLLPQVAPRLPVE